MDDDVCRGDDGPRRPRGALGGGQTVRMGDGRCTGGHGRLWKAGRAATASLLAGVVSLLAASPASAGLLPPPPPTIKVIVQQLDPSDPAPALLVKMLGGDITRSLPIVTGFA